MNWLFLLALGCVILAVLMLLSTWAFDLFRATDEEYERKREWYKQAIRDEIDAITEGKVLDNEYLNELLQEYWNLRRR